MFLNGGMGRFDEMCAEAVRKLKEQHPEKDIRLCLVAAHLSNQFNTEKSYYQTFYDEILLLKEVEYICYKAKLLAGQSDGFVISIASTAEHPKHINIHRKIPNF